MLLKRTVNIFLPLALNLTLPLLVLADVLNTTRLRQYGTVTSISSDGVEITRGCDSTDTVRVAWSNIRTITFTPKCTESTVPIGFGAGSDKSCEAEFVNLLLVKFNSGAATVATSVEMDADKTFSIKLYDSGRTFKGPAASVAGVKRLRMCSTSAMLGNMLKIGSLPPDFKP